MIFKHSKEKTWVTPFISDKGRYYTNQVVVSPKTWHGSEAFVKVVTKKKGRCS